MAGDAPTRRPTVDDLLNVRTPADIAVGPDGNVVFSVHATVSERGVSIPSDLWSLDVDGRAVNAAGKIELQVDLGRAKRADRGHGIEPGDSAELPLEHGGHR